MNQHIRFYIKIILLFRAIVSALNLFNWFLRKIRKRQTYCLISEKRSKGRSNAEGF